jgi:glycosyltransferase involved in cell wall biosynthesis
MTAPRISIITPSLNSARYLPEMMASVLTQTGDFQLEWIVIDGGSTDETHDLLQSANDPRLRWISEKDSGQTAAINRGLSLIKGDIVAWLNCDDCYVPGTLSTVAKAFLENPTSHWLIGRCDIIDPLGKLSRPQITRFKNRKLDRFTFSSLLAMNIISQPAVFWRADFGRQIGNLDESLFWTMDYDLWLRMAQNAPPVILKETLAKFRVHETSKSRGGHRPQFEEGYRVACRYAKTARVRLIHRLGVEKIVWGYRALRLVGR